jgi:hypothetical protein
MAVVAPAAADSHFSGLGTWGVAHVDSMRRGWLDNTIPVITKEQQLVQRTQVPPPQRHALPRRMVRSVLWWLAGLAHLRTMHRIVDQPSTMTHTCKCSCKCRGRERGQGAPGHEEQLRVMMK